MKRTLFCWIVALSMGIMASQAQTDTTQKEPSPSTKAAETKPAPPSLPAPGLPAPKPSTAPAKEVAVIKTSMGEMVLEFWPDLAPKHVENFKKLANQGFYDGTAFHRVVNGFMIQGGDPNTKDEAKKELWGRGGPGYTVKAEFNDRPHVRGVLSMARSGHPDSAGCQFFICLGPASSLDRQYTAFGKLIKGDDVLGKIGDTPVGLNPSGTEKSAPLTRVNVDSVKIVGIDTVK